jgi:hypothetical protein
MHRSKAIGDGRMPGVGGGRPLEELLDEIHCTALDVIVYLADLQSPNGQVDDMGAACLQRYLELLDELARRWEREPPW